jgi:hypothetical protein
MTDETVKGTTGGGGIMERDETGRHSSSFSFFCVFSALSVIS